MPIHEFACTICGRIDDIITSKPPADAEEVCRGCGAPSRYAGLGACFMRTPKPTGITLKSGKFLKGWWGSAPLKKRDRIKTFK